MKIKEIVEYLSRYPEEYEVCVPSRDGELSTHLTIFDDSANNKIWIAADPPQSEDIKCLRGKIISHSIAIFDIFERVEAIEMAHGKTGINHDVMDALRRASAALSLMVDAMDAAYGDDDH